MIDIRTIIRFLTVGVREGSLSPNYYRLNPANIKDVDVRFIGGAENLFNFIIFVENDTDEKIAFFESIFVTKNPTTNARVLGKINEKYLVDSFSDVNGANKLMEICQDFENKAIKANIVLERNLESENIFPFKVTSIKPLSESEEFATTNLVYVWTIENVIFAKPRSILVKKYMPRKPINRGTKEYMLLKFFSTKQLVPQTYGALRIIDWEYVATFQELLENAKEIKEEIWSTINKLDSENIEKVLVKLEHIVYDAIKNTVIPFHKLATEEFGENKIFKDSKETYVTELFNQLEHTLNILETLEIFDRSFSREVAEVFKKMWKIHVSKRPYFLIHNDLMWEQLLRGKYDRIFIIDLDKNTLGHVEKDIADICAANRFIANVVIENIKEKAKMVMEQLNKFVIDKYFELMFLEDTRSNKEEYNNAIQFYLALKHLNDVAYYAPLTTSKEVYKHFVSFSLVYFNEKFEKLKVTIGKEMQQ
ncbi:MAG: hypothetical protein ACP6IS_09920 [Candidatus Asgardarchaeia archaeon]